MATPRGWYTAYLETPWWGAVRAAALALAGYRCADCGFNARLRDRRRHLEVHHLTYDRLYGERPTDLAVLCDYCHKRRHGLPFEPRWSQGREPVPIRQVIVTVSARWAA